MPKKHNLDQLKSTISDEPLSIGLSITLTVVAFAWIYIKFIRPKNINRRNMEEEKKGGEPA